MSIQKESFQKLEEDGLPRVAASNYLNTAPLVWSFRHGSMRGAVDLATDAAPARCADLLASGGVDAALVPAIEYQRLAEVRVVPGVCVGARERVRSVVIVTRERKDLRSVRQVALDTSSRTSVALTQIIFREFLTREPAWISSAPDINRMLREADAALLIGDPAMTFPRTDDVRVYDLAEVWRKQTGLGFVFALWMVRTGTGEKKAHVVRWTEARDEGLAHADDIASMYEDALRLDRAELRAYLLENICYELDDEMLAGLDLFYRLAHKHQIIETVLPLKFLA